MKIQKWEYWLEYNATEEELNRLGAKGWELHTILPEQPEPNIAFYFKRPLQD